jgi:nickel transport protein
MAAGRWQRRSRLIALSMLLMAAMPVLAHKLNVFAAADGARIVGSAYFAGGAKATGARIIITNAAGAVLAELDPAADGSFSYQASAPVAHRIIAESIDGHRAEWRITADELAGAFRSGAQDTSEPAAGGEGVRSKAETDSTADQPPPTTPVALAPGLDAAIERAVARQIRPLREELLATRDALRLRDILGGVGYIFGLVGLALWWHGRRPPGRG